MKDTGKLVKDCLNLHDYLRAKKDTGGLVKDRLTLRDYFAAKALQAYIDENVAGWGLDEMSTAYRLLSELAGRVTRMRQARDRMEGGQDDELVAAIHEALDSLSADWGVEL